MFYFIANLSVISFRNSTRLDAGIYTGNDLNMTFYNDSGYDFTFMCDAGQLAVCPEDGGEAIKYKYDGRNYKYTVYLPDKNGTIATIADIKSYYTHYITLYRTSYFYISFQITNTTSTKYNSLSAIAKAVDSIAPYDIAANTGIPCIGIIKGNNSTTLSIPVNLYSDENMTSLIVNTCGVINSNGGNISAYTSAYTISATYTVINDLVR